MLGLVILISELVGGAVEQGGFGVPSGGEGKVRKLGAGAAQTREVSRAADLGSVSVLVLSSHSIERVPIGILGLPNRESGLRLSKEARSV